MRITELHVPVLASPTIVGGVIRYPYYFLGAVAPVDFG
jgi:hypothetical protein